MKTILQILPSLDKINGGVERGTLDIARELAQREYNSVIISSGGEMADRYKYKDFIEFNIVDDNPKGTKYNISYKNSETSSGDIKTSGDLIQN